MKILLIAGGWSSEREVSLIGARSIKPALESLGHTVTFCDLRDDFDKVADLASAHDFAYLNLHGTPGEDGLVQSILDSVDCPYQSPGPAPSFLSLNKAAAKQILRHAGLPTADWEFLPVPPAEGWEPKLSYPIFVKSNQGGSSLFLGRANNRQELDALCKDIFEHGDSVLLEPELKGKDLTCGLIGGEPLPPLLIIPLAGTFFDYTSKYSDGGSQEICPAPIPEETTKRVQDLTVKACSALGIEYGRVDYILGEDGSLHILEINTIPGMTPASIVPKEAKAVGMDFPQLLDRLISIAMKKRSKQK